MTDELRQGITELLRREHAQAQAATYASRDEWATTAQGTGETSHEHFARMTKRTVRAWNLLSEWGRIQGEIPKTEP